MKVITSFVRTSECVLYNRDHAARNVCGDLSAWHGRSPSWAGDSILVTKENLAPDDGTKFLRHWGQSHGRIAEPLLGCAAVARRRPSRSRRTQRPLVLRPSP